MSSKIKVDTIENVAGSGNVSLGSGHNLVVPGNITGQGATTLTGDLTVDTSTLKVDSSNNRVGIGTNSPSNSLDVQTSAGKFSVEALGGGSVRLASNGSMGLNVAAGYNYEIDVDGTEVVRIDSSGRLGIGATPTAQFSHSLLQVGAQATLGANKTLSTTGQTFLTHNLYYNTDGNLRVFNTSSANEGAILQMADGKFLFSNSTATTGTPTVTEHARLLTNGAFQIKVGGAPYDNWGSNSTQCQINSDETSTVTFTVNAATSSFGLDVQRLVCDRGNTSAYDFLTCTSGNLGDDEFHLRGDGNGYADASWNGGGADYAEYFEWKDGNTSSEDRVGISVKLDGDKIVASSDSDNASDIIGVISGNPSVVGDSAYMKWNEKYLKDDYGRYKRDENGERIQNPDYDETKTYISREDRKEWDAVGLMGKLRIKKGQKTGTNWIKMRDVSSTVEEWLVR